MTIKERREALGISQAALARTLGVVPATVCGWESGRFAPSASMLPRIAAELNCKIDDLFTKEVKPSA